MPRARKPLYDPLPGAALLDAVFARAKLLPKAREFRALAAFAQVAGTKVLKHARGERYADGTLYVRVTSAGWSQELSLLRSDLLRRLREEAGCPFVRDLRFSVGPLADLPDFNELAGDAPEAPRAAPPEPPPADPAEDAAVAEALLAIPDESLRHALGDLYARARTRR